MSLARLLRAALLVAALTLPAAADQPAQYWILQGPRLEAQAMATDPRAVRFFSKRSRIVIYPAVAKVPPPRSWHVLIWRKYDSYEQFAHDVAANAVPQGTQIVGYDPEKWDLTPTDEQSDPVAYTIKFAQLAHAHGYKFLATPAINLMNVQAPRRNKYTAFVASGFARSVAPSVDFYNIQAQGLQHNVNGAPPSYAWFVNQIAGQIRAANPNAVITAGISTNTPGYFGETTAGDIASSAKAAAPLVTGYWINVVRGNSEPAVRALEDLDSGSMP